MPDARLAEVVAALSLAIDMGTGKEQGRGLRGALVALQLGESLGLGEEELQHLYYTSLLSMLGCTAETSSAAAMIGDEIAFGTAFAPLVNAPRGEMMGWMLRNYASDERFARRVSRVARMMTAGRAFFEDASRGHCEVAQRLADRLGVDPAVRATLGAVFERWSGDGRPRGLRGDQVPMAIRILHVVWDVDTFGDAGGVEAWTAVLRRRAGRTLDPAVVDAAVRDPAAVEERLRTPSPWDAALAAEPGTPRPAGDVDDAAAVIADFVDLKSDHLRGHSRSVATLAGAAAQRLGLDAQGVATVGRAGLLHDLGRVAVSTTVWDKPGPLTDAEWEMVRLHPYHGERILCRTPVFAAAARVAGAHHERCDGSGYHRGAAAAELPPEARVLAAADSFAAMTETRAHRPARPRADAARELGDEVRRGTLDGDAVAAVVAAAGEDAVLQRPPLPAGLSDREAQVLAMLARGLATKQIAQRLGISPKTADHHVQSGYRKIGVATRAGATVFAMEHGLLAR